MQHRLCWCCVVLQCGFPVTPRLQLVLPDGADIISIVWKDNLNRTVALDTSQVQLPPLAPLMEASVANTEQCNTGCDWSYHVSSDNSIQLGHWQWAVVNNLLGQARCKQLLSPHHMLTSLQPLPKPFPLCSGLL
jgi:hypothetical protein